MPQGFASLQRLTGHGQGWRQARVDRQALPWAAPGAVVAVVVEQCWGAEAGYAVAVIRMAGYLMMGMAWVDEGAGVSKEVCGRSAMDGAAAALAGSPETWHSLEVR